MTLTIDEHWRGKDAEIGLLRGLPHLTTLVLHRAPLTDAALEQIPALSRLEVLDIDSCQFSAAALDKLRMRHPRLRVLTHGN